MECHRAVLLLMYAVNVKNPITFMVQSTQSERSYAMYAGE